jgi:hypothetical protein
MRLIVQSWTRRRSDRLQRRYVRARHLHGLCADVLDQSKDREGVGCKPEIGVCHSKIISAAKIKLGVGILAHDCVVIDMSGGGVRLYIAGFDVLEEFTLLLSGEGVVRESRYKVVWRRGHEGGRQVC